MNDSVDHIIIMRKKRLRQMGLIIFSSVLLGILYPVIDKEFDNLMAFVNGSMIGLLGGLAIAIHEDHRNFKKIKREHFILRLIKSVALYTGYFALIVALTITVTGSMVSGQGLAQYITGPEFRHFIFHEDYLVIVTYTLFFCGLVTFTVIMSRKIESRVIFNMISGKYRKPVEEHRIFMAIDLNNSTYIAEDLQETAFYEFLNRFYLDLTPAIISTNGQIYRYVGDQILISWPLGTAEQNNSCLRFYFIAKDELNRQREQYLSKWGQSPTFKAVIHAGKVIAGEIGDFKSQFVFHGEVLQQLGLMEKHCKSIGVDLLLSSDYLEIADLPPDYQLAKRTAADADPRLPVLYTAEQPVKNMV